MTTRTERTVPAEWVEAPGCGRQRAAARGFDEDAQVLDVFNVHLKNIKGLFNNLFFII